MPEIEPPPSTPVALEDGEIDEDDEPSSITPLMGGGADELPLPFVNNPPIQTDNDEIALIKGVYNDKIDLNQPSNESKDPPTSSLPPHNDEELYLYDENEMLCVRGASPVPYCIDVHRVYARTPPIYDSDTTYNDISPPKKRRTPKKIRSRKRSKPKKLIRHSLSTEEEQKAYITFPYTESLQQENLPQVCKFYLLGCCTKSHQCEYMHSQFPCKFFYMDLPCEAELNNDTCKLSHGGPLSQEMFCALIRHIHRAPNDLLGKNFVKLRSNLTLSEVMDMLHKVQEKLRHPAENKSKEEQPLNLIASMREKLYFLRKEQIDKLQELRISRSEDLLNLTLAQLSSIGILANQVEAIQMSLNEAEDIDMRSIFQQNASADVVSKANDIDDRKMVVEDICTTNWYEIEELPLIIDESVKEETNEQKDNDGLQINVTSITLPEESSDPLETFEKVFTDSTESEVEVTVENELTTGNFIEVEFGTQGACDTMENNLPSQVSVEKREEENSTIKVKEAHKVLEIDISEHQSDRSQQFPRDDKMPLQRCDEDSVENAKTALPEVFYEGNYSPQWRDESYACNSQRIEYPEGNAQTPWQILNDDKKFPKWRDKSNRTSAKVQGDIQLTDGFTQKLPNKHKPPPIKFTVGKRINSPTRSPNSSTVITSSSSYTNQRKVQQFRPGVNPFRCYDGFEDESWDSPKQQQLQKPTENKSTTANSKLFYPIVNNKMQVDENSSEDWDADEQNETPTAPVSQNAKQTIRTEISITDSPGIKGFDVTINNITCPAEFPRRKPNLDNYIPAVEVSAHLTNPPMEYKLYEILFQNVVVNKPTNIDKLINTSSKDPRLKKFLDKEKNLGFLPQREYSFFPAAENAQDPRLRSSCVKTCPANNYNASPILYGYLQRSLWYLGLKSNLKIQINHSVSELVRALNAFHMETSPHKIFDFFKIECAGVLLEVMQNVGIHIDVKGNIIETANYHQLCAPKTKQHDPRSQQACNNNGNSYSVGGRPIKPGLLGYAPSEIMYSRPPPLMHGINENSFMRQAFGNEFLNYCNNGPPESGFYVREENFNRNRSSGGGSNFEPGTYQRRPNQNIVRRM